VPAISWLAEEARSFRDWLLRAVAGSPEQIQIMYGVGGERRLEEVEAPVAAGAMKIRHQCESAVMQPCKPNSTFSASYRTRWHSR
jgi:hypothetical protein